ncbi:hypothetical protein L2E82_35869 [Cichorium intybus]|uniref:Uncharacterized protein n=1 Tax=Cichorium intybus TaxID=13427 RepID=A0ACB9BQ96_CICIN|nr:hypothetical protein L2E82_35869 [Cichorium intybus]
MDSTQWKWQLTPPVIHYLEDGLVVKSGIVPKIGFSLQLFSIAALHHRHVPIVKRAPAISENESVPRLDGNGIDLSLHPKILKGSSSSYKNTGFDTDYSHAKDLLPIKQQHLSTLSVSMFESEIVIEQN